MKKATIDALNDIIKEYDTVIKVVDSEAHSLNEDGERAYGGYIRATKGRLQEHITKRLIEISWGIELNQNMSRLDINSTKIDIPINKFYISHLPDYLQDYIKKHLTEYFYGLSVDRQIFIDNIFVSGIECKAYTENAMLKRILVDFMLLKTKYENINCHLFQLESMLGGDYSKLNDNEYGSKVSHTIMSYFPTVNLDILTFIEGERDVKKPIHDKRYYKPLPLKSLKKGINIIVNDLIKFSK